MSVYAREVFRYVILASALLAAAPRPVFTDALVTLLGAPSHDGRFLSLVEQGDLAIRDLSTRRSVRLTRAQGREFAYFSAISRDSKSVAYAWFNAEGFYELRVLPLAGGEPRTLFRNPEAGFVQPCAWTPDGKFILTLLFRKDNVSQIALVPAAGGPAQVLRSLNWVYPKRMDISPDGSTLIYDSFAPGSTTDRTIYSLTLDGTTERRLVEEPGNHLFPLYAPDGKSFYHLSGDALVHRSLQGSARIVQAGMGRALPLGITSAGKLYYGLRQGTSDVFLAPVGNTVQGARRASARFPNRNLAPGFSPGGKQLAYLSRRGAENFGQDSRAVVTLDLESGEETEQPVRMAHIERVQWSFDGRALLLSGTDGKGRGGLFSFDLSTRRTTPLVTEPGGAPKGYDFYPRPGGFFYVDAGVLKNEKQELEGSLADLPARLAGFPLPFPSGVTEWLPTPDALFAVRGTDLLRFSRDGETRTSLPGNLQPGASISRDGKTIALTAGRETREIWVVELP